MTYFKAKTFLPSSPIQTPVMFNSSLVVHYHMAYNGLRLTMADGSKLTVELEDSKPVVKRLNSKFRR